MFPGLKTDSLPICQLFDAPYAFAIPTYQRQYSWTTREVGQLLDDITSAAGIEDAQTASPDYFLGTVLLLDPAADGADAPGAPLPRPAFDVVDGQQRLVTLMLLASVLETVVEDAELQRRLRAMIQNRMPGGGCRILPIADERAFFEVYVLSQDQRPPVDPNPDVVAPTDGLLRVAYGYLLQEISALAPADREALARYLIECCHVVVIITRDIDRAHLLFTVLNDRGRPLQRKDILKAEVLQTVPPVHAARALALWDGAQAKLGNDFESLFSHIRTIHAGGRPQIISAIRSLVRHHGCEAFLTDILTPLAGAFHLVRRFPEAPDRAHRHPALAAALNSLNRFGHADWVPPTLIAMARFESDPAWCSRVVVEIDRMMFLLKILALGGAKRQRRTSQVVQALMRGVSHEIDNAFAISREEARAALHHLKDIHRRNAGLAKLTLMRIEDELRGTPLLMSTTELSVEHVLPQRLPATSGWRELFPDADQREACTHSLGNLLLVPPKVNERLRNKEFADKKEIIAGLPSGPADTLLLNSDLISAASWTAADIAAREKRLLQVLETVLRLGAAGPNGGAGGPPAAL